MTVKNPVAAIKTRRANKRYEAMIAASQSKIGTYKHIPYVPKVIA
jgi:hypothetical protein